MNRLYLSVWIILNSFVQLSVAQDTTSTSLTEVGQMVPQFSVTTLDGHEFNSRELNGKVTLINFFATWCGPCNAEMPHLEKDIWQRFKDDDFTVIAIGREHSKEEVSAFKKKKELSFPMAPDPDREIYKLFATMYIPRNYIIDKESRIVYQAKGFTNEEFDRIVEKIQQLLKK